MSASSDIDSSDGKTKSGSSKLKFAQSASRAFVADFQQRTPGLAPPEIPLITTDHGDGLAELKKLGFDVDPLESASVAQSNAWVEAVRAKRKKEPLASNPKIAAVQRRFLSATPGADYLTPEVVILAPIPDLGPIKFPPYVPGSITPAVYPQVEPFLNSQGSGLGWTDSDSKREQVLVSFCFFFTPLQTGNYTFSALIWMSGSYTLTARDQWWNSKKANASVSFGMNVVPVSQAPDAEGGTSVSFLPDQDIPPSWSMQVFEKGDDNIHASGSMSDAEALSFNTATCTGPITAGTPTLIGVFAYLYTYAQGAGSLAELDFTGTGNGVGCAFVRATLNM